MSPFKLIENNKPVPALLKLFNALGITHNNDILALNKLAQENFLRKPGQERWNMPEMYPDKRSQILPILEELGVIEEILPSASSYDFIFIHGGFISRMRKRLHFLNSLWPTLDKKIRENTKIILLSGARPLDPKQEGPAALAKQEFSSIPFRPEWKTPETLPQTEDKLVPFLWDQIISNEELQSKVAKNDVLFVNAPSRENKRPNTKDTFDFWLESWKNKGKYPKEYQDFWEFIPASPYQAKYLAISDNPFIPYQDWVLRNIFKKEEITKVSLETVGPSADADLPLSVHLDNIARWLYEEVRSIHI